MFDLNKDLKLKVEGLDRDSIIATLIVTKKLDSKDARAYYDKYHKIAKAKPFTALFDDYIKSEAVKGKEIGETEVIAFIKANAGELADTKLKTKGYFISRALLVNDVAEAIRA